MRLAAVLTAAAIAGAGVTSLALAGAPASDPSASRAADSGCRNASKPARELERAALRKATMCLVNKERRRHARSPVARSKALQSAAQKHARKMVATDCLSHRCPGEVGLSERIRRSGYLRGAKSWRFAENTGCGLTAEAMVKNWMASRFHRINIVHKRYRDVGVGVVQRRVEGRCGKGFATFSVVLGYRRP